MFTGCPPEMIDFFLALRFNNNAAYFEANRALYQRVVQAPLRALADAMAQTLAEIDPQFDTRPVKVVSRIRRDTRFSHNKDPYRDYMWLSWRYTGETLEAGLCFYWDVSPDATHWGMGIFGDHKPTMDVIRRRILAAPNEVAQVLAASGVPERFTLEGNAYKRLVVPDEVPEALRALYIKKGYYFQNNARADDFDALFSGDIAARMRADFLLLAPLYRWLRGRQLELADAQTGRE